MIAAALLPAAAWAQACASGKDAALQGCDTAYQSLQVTCSTYGTTPPCPPEKTPMVMKTTGTKPQSLITDFSPYLFAYARDAKDNSRPYSGELSRGTIGDASQTFQMIGNPTLDANTGAGATRQNSCVNQIDISDMTPAEQAKVVRLQLDNCTNQYILHTAISPEYRKNPVLPSGEDSKNPAAPITMDSYCQPLRTLVDGNPDYVPSDYLKLAWQKMLINPEVRKPHAPFKFLGISLPPPISTILQKVLSLISGFLPGSHTSNEPSLPSGVKLQNTSDPAVQPPANFPTVTLTQIATPQEGAKTNYEVILDPTHPYSPRWDFFYNDRALSPAVTPYQFDPENPANENAIYCAGERGTPRLAAIASAISGLDPATLSSVLDPSKIASLAEDKLKKALDPSKLTGVLDKVKDQVTKQVTAMTESLKKQATGALAGIANFDPSSMFDLSQFANLDASVRASLLNGDLLAKFNTDQLASMMDFSQFSKLDPAVLGDMINVSQFTDLASKGLDSVADLDKLSASLSSLDPSALKNIIPVDKISNFSLDDIKANISLPKLNLLEPSQLGAMIDMNQWSQLKPDQILGMVDKKKLARLSVTQVKSLVKTGGLKNLDRATLTGIVDPSKVPGGTDLVALANTDPNKLVEMIDPQKFIGLDSVSMSAAFDTDKVSALGKDGMGTILDTTGMQSVLTGASLAAADMQSVAKVLNPSSLSKLVDVKALSVNISPSMLGGIINPKSFNAVIKLDSLPKLDKLSLGNVMKVSSLASVMDVNAFSKLDVNVQAKLLSGNMLKDALDINNLKSSLGTDVVAGLVDEDKLSAVTGGLTGAKKNEKIYKVDVLEFRRKAFEKNMIQDRVGFNALCFADPVTPITTPIWVSPQIPAPNPLFLAMIAGSYCWTVTSPPVWLASPGTATRLPCWQCFGHAPGVRVMDKPGDKPPCTTHYDGEDQKMLPFPFIPGGLNKFSYEAHCTMNPADKKVSIKQVCKDLRRPFAPINVLKMRYHNPDDKENDELPAGVPEGYTFKEYFGDHMPYPRLWDTGQSIQASPGNDQDPMDTMGQYTAIVGVGREAGAPPAPASGSGSSASSSSSSTATSSTPAAKDERCMYGGWGKDVGIAGQKIKVPDPITSWTELKLYQARTTREQHLVCLGRYEKVFKPRSSEGQLTMRGSGTYIEKQACHTNQEGKTECRVIHDGDAPPAKNEILRDVPRLIPAAWRGYLSDPDSATQYPNFASNSAGSGIHRGLNDVRCGDILLMPSGAGDGKSANTRGLPKLARVVALNTPKHRSCQTTDNASETPSDCESKKNCYVEVQEADNGKWPDVCGTTEVLGGLQKRTLYKSGHYPKSSKKALDAISWTHGCEDPGLNACELSIWDSIQYYRQSEDVRKGN